LLGTRPCQVGAGVSSEAAFDELVRTSEGIPRDAVCIATKAAMQARGREIYGPIVQDAA
jgi:hypothetical protein